MAEATIGKVVQVIGPVLDVERAAAPTIAPISPSGRPAAAMATGMRAKAWRMGTAGTVAPAAGRA